MRRTLVPAVVAALATQAPAAAHPPAGHAAGHAPGTTVHRHHHELHPAGGTHPAHRHAIAPAGDPRVVERDFLAAAARSLHPRAGDLFTLPDAYNSVVEPVWLIPETSLLPGGETVKHVGTWHSGPWKYDTRIPLILHAPGLVRAGARPTGAATQQDLPATLAWAMHTTPPRDCGGRALTEAFARRPARPRVVLTIVLDQGGRAMLDAHPRAWPEIAKLRAAGADFVNAEVTHLEAETALGHVAVGTGAWPDRTGIPSNYFFHGGAGDHVYTFDAETRHAPLFLEAPTLADHWLAVTRGQAIVASHSQSDRAAMGMGGHGAYFQGNPKPFVTWFDSKSGKLSTHERYYRVPEGVKDLQATPYRKELVGEGGTWLGHAIADDEDAKRTPALARFEGDAIAKLLASEPIGKDDVTDLVYVSFKGPDYAGHRYGLESVEARDVLREVDAQVGRLVRLVAAAAGEGNYLVAITADHGSTPLQELSGGARLNDEDLLGMINKAFPSGSAKAPTAVYATSAEIWLDQAALKAQGKTPADVGRFVRGIKVKGKPFYRLVVDRATVAKRRAELGLAGR